MTWKMINLDDGRHECPEYEQPLVLVCEDVGTIVSATVNNWTDNYPCFRLNLITDRGMFECGHKYSYMGKMKAVCGELLYGDLIYHFLPERVPYFENGVQHGDFSREQALARCKKEKKPFVTDEFPRRDRVYFTDPRLQYLAYAGLIGEPSSLYGTSREHHFAPHVKSRESARAWLEKYGLYGESFLKDDINDFYEKLEVAFKALRLAHRGKQLV